METICSNCKAEIAEGEKLDWCPGCGGALVQRAVIDGAGARSTPEIDHRGIVLPRRAAVGGIITPQ